MPSAGQAPLERRGGHGDQAAFHLLHLEHVDLMPQLDDRQRDVALLVAALAPRREIPHGARHVPHPVDPAPAARGPARSAGGVRALEEDLEAGRLQSFLVVGEDLERGFLLRVLVEEARQLAGDRCRLDDLVIGLPLLVEPDDDFVLTESSVIAPHQRRAGIGLDQGVVLDGRRLRDVRGNHRCASEDDAGKKTTTASRLIHFAPPLFGGQPTRRAFYPRFPEGCPSSTQPRRGGL